PRPCGRQGRKSLKNLKFFYMIESTLIPNGTVRLDFHLCQGIQKPMRKSKIKRLACKLPRHHLKRTLDKRYLMCSSKLDESQISFHSNRLHPTQPSESLHDHSRPATQFQNAFATQVPYQSVEIPEELLVSLRTVIGCSIGDGLGVSFATDELIKYCIMVI